MGRKTAQSFHEWESISCPMPAPELGMEDLEVALRSAVRLRRRPSPEDLKEAVAHADQVLEECTRLELALLCIDDTSFPASLRAIPDPPITLFVRGSLRGFSGKPRVALIGTREPSEFAARCSRRLGALLAEGSIPVVSGLAKGCDTEAHRGCIEHGGTALAVMAHGLDAVYPAANRSLADAIVDCGGCLVSEYAPGVRAQRSYFVERDRIQSGLSDAVIVMETSLTGGSMHTVRFAEQQGRLVGCVPPRPEQGNNASVAGGAELLKSSRAEAIADQDSLARFLGRLRGGLSPSEGVPRSVQGSLFDEHVE
ncbi:MAG: DNA-processing protein DprA [Planctomycetota bacterium]